MKLWQKVLLGLILGCAFGHFFPTYAAELYYLSDIFMGLIKTIIPLVLFTTMVTGITGMKDPSSAGRLVRKSIFAYLATTCFAVTFGLGVAYLLKPGKDIVLPQNIAEQCQEYKIKKAADNAKKKQERQEALDNIEQGLAPDRGVKLSNQEEVLHYKQAVDNIRIKDKEKREQIDQDFPGRKFIIVRFYKKIMRKIDRAPKFVFDEEKSTILDNALPGDLTILVKPGSDNILKVLFFSFVFGFIINQLGSKADHFKNFIHSSSHVALKGISWIVQLSPYAAFISMSVAISDNGVENISTLLSKLFLALFTAFTLQYVIYGVLIFWFTGLSPMPFYKKSLEYQLLAFSTGSSKASLSTTMQVCKEKLGISESCTSFVLPLGAAINMNGLAIKLGLTSLFFAQLFKIELGLIQYLTIIAGGTIGSIGGAGVPGAFIIMLPALLEALGIPTIGVGLLLGLDRVLDLFSTAINITGDAAVTLIVDHREGNTDQEIYYSDQEETIYDSNDNK